MGDLPAPSMSTQARDGEQPRDAASKTVDGPKGGDEQTGVRTDAEKAISAAREVAFPCQSADQPRSLARLKMWLCGPVGEHVSDLVKERKNDSRVEPGHFVVDS